MPSKVDLKLLLNTDHGGHGAAIERAISGAIEMQCMVAFMKYSGLRSIEKLLKRSLESGLTARFAVGLNFAITEPNALRALLRLARRHDLQLYLCDDEYTFHPKIYAFEKRRGATVLIGSANLTAGGLSRNYEASAEIRDSTGKLYQSVKRHFDALIDESILQLATTELIDAYEPRFLAQRVEQNLAKRRLVQVLQNPDGHLMQLQEILRVMEADKSNDGLDAQRRVRHTARSEALSQIRRLARMVPMTTEQFLPEYVRLIENFHSGGLQRAKTTIARQAAAFQSALAVAVDVADVDAATAFDRLRQLMLEIPRAGVNVITEVLLALNPKRFAVMNQNAVAGMRRGDVRGFPSKPTKQNVSGEDYLRFCNEAERLRQGLKLDDFCELDAVFNYAYWNAGESPSDEEA